LENGYEGDCVFTTEYNKLVVNNSTDVLTMLEDFRLRYPQFRGAYPNDVQEAVLCIIDIFEKSIGIDWFKKHFYGKMTTKISWDGGAKESVEDFSCHTINVGDDFFENTTYIDGYDVTEDERCTHASIYTYISHLSSVFMISFNQYNNIHIVDLPEYIKGYRLCAAALYMGGHYVALVREGDEWYIYNDESKIKVEQYISRGSYYFATYI
jgi:hypothetical protein